jgi:hypothetical protein
MVMLQNEACSLSFDRQGGAWVDFHRKPGGMNPLNFHLEQDVPGAQSYSFRGHFLCLGRWGDPSPGEAAKGHVKHGDFNRLEWTAEANGNGCVMRAESPLEGLFLERTITLDRQAPLVTVKELVHNTGSLGRLYQMVQHPTLTAPFLAGDTLVDCNATTGFDYAFETYDEAAFCQWPVARTTRGEQLHLGRPERPYSSVFSFIVDPAEEWGWITAYAPAQQLLLGYVWPRIHYPWIHHWLHFEQDTLRYRGLEFGTTGVHKSFQEIWERQLLQVLGTPACSYIDSGETQQRQYSAFQLPVPAGFTGVQRVEVGENALHIVEKGSGTKNTLLFHQPLYDGI